jgi:DNA-binding SARP family transcriptional activator/TolB-like protein
MRSTFRLRAFGGLSLERDGAPYVGPASQRRRLALLAILASATNGVSRDRLMSYLWPDADPERVRHSLDDALSALRRELGRDDLFLGVGSLQLNPDALETDLAEYAAALRSGDFERAAGLYAGPFADGFYVPGAGDLERWTESERVRRGQEHRRALEGAATAAAERGDGADVVRWRQAIVSADPLNTSATLELLRALSAVGNLAEVRRIARVHETLLRDELGATPGSAWDAELERLVTTPVPPRTVAGGPEAGTGARADGGGGATRVEEPNAVGRPTNVGAAGRDAAPPAAAPPSSTAARARRWGAAAVVVVAVALAMLSVGSRDARRGRADSVPRVLVAGFENATGDTTLTPLGGMIADWVQQGLAQTGIVDVIAWGPASAAMQGGDARLRAAAAESRASAVISGVYYRDGDSLRLHPRVVDVERSTLLRPIAPISVPLRAPNGTLEPARQRIIAALAVVYDPRYAGWEMGTPPPTYEAYRQYLIGVDLFARGDGARALSHFAQAVALDSAYAQPMLHSVDAYVTLDRIADADSLLRILERRRGSLTPFERAAVDRARGLVDGDHMAALVAARAAARAAPGAQLPHFLHAVSAFRANRPAEALAAASRVSSFRQIDRGEPVITTVWQGLVANSHHMLGDYAAELAAVRAWRASAPENPVLVAFELRALAALGRVADVQTLLERTGGGYPAREPPRLPFVLRDLDEELDAHTHVDLARAVRRRAVESLRRRPAGEPGVAQSGYALARVLYRAGAYDDAETELAALESQRPADAFDHALQRGLIAARRGRRDEARRLAESLLALERPYDFGRTAYARAQIAAQTGDRALALSLLRQAFDEGMSHGPATHADGELAPLRSDPAFQELIRPKG